MSSTTTATTTNQSSQGQVIGSLQTTGVPSSNPADEAFAGHDEEQIRLMEERCIVVDNDDQVLRDGSKKECHLMTNIQKGLLHRAFSVFLFDPITGKLLLQKRASEKITFPNMWTNTCCSHPLAIKGELEEVEQIGVRRAAQRKLDHELGIAPEEVPLDEFQFLTRIHYLAPSDGLWGEHEIDYILFITAPVNVKPNPNEISEVKWVNAQELQALMNELDPSSFTPWFKLIASKFLFPWWNTLIQRKTNSPQSKTASHSASQNGVAVVDAKSLADLQDQTLHRML